jgi:DNA-binding protein HU-beta
MTKADIVDIIAEGTGLTKVETQAVVDGFLATMSYNLRTKKRVELRGFGNFRVVRRSARLARNPKTGEPVYIREHETVVFRPSKELKEFINRRRNEQVE